VEKARGRDVGKKQNQCQERWEGGGSARARTWDLPGFKTEKEGKWGSASGWGQGSRGKKEKIRKTKGWEGSLNMKVRNNGKKFRQKKKPARNLRGVGARGCSGNHTSRGGLNLRSDTEEKSCREGLTYHQTSPTPRPPKKTPKTPPNTPQNNPPPPEQKKHTHHPPNPTKPPPKPTPPIKPTPPPPPITHPLPHTRARLLSVYGRR